MTNKEAIEILRANYPDACFGQLREAVDAAIEALKAQNVAGDTISRQAAIDALGEEPLVWHEDDAGEVAERNQWRRDVAAIKALPSAQPDIIQCRNCKFASGDSRICMKFDHSPIGELDFCSFAERREVTT